MPKIKTRQAAAKRFSKTGTGKFRLKHSHHSHILTKKSTKRKRGLRKRGSISHQDTNRVAKMVPYL
ncbi:MAG TPA: 50S ribosomal protein L35 [bacterium]|jgi:large subunit ribosomal protein L35